MTTCAAVLGTVTVVLLILNVYQFLVRRESLRIAEILYVMSRNVRDKASEVRQDQKDVEIVEAHLSDIATSTRSLLRALGRSDKSLGHDPEADALLKAHRFDSAGLVRLADRIFYAVAEDARGIEWEEVVDRALSRFREKVPSLDLEGAKRIVASVAQQYAREDLSASQA